MPKICIWVERCQKLYDLRFESFTGCWIIRHRMKNIFLRIKILALEIFLAQSTQNAPKCFIFSDKKIIPKYLIFFMQMTLKIIFRALSYFHLMSSLWVCFLCFFIFSRNIFLEHSFHFLFLVHNTCDHMLRWLLNWTCFGRIEKKHVNNKHTWIFRMESIDVVGYWVDDSVYFERMKLKWISLHDIFIVEMFFRCIQHPHKLRPHRLLRLCYLQFDNF